MRTQFLVTSGRRKGHKFEVADSEFKIGRKKDRDLVLDDESVSGHHATIYQEDGKVWVRDCDSVNGVLLNGKPVKKSSLKQGDVLAVGLTEITVVGGEEEKEEEFVPRTRMDGEKGGGGSADRPPGISRLVKAIVAIGLLAILAAAVLKFGPVVQKWILAHRGPKAPTAVVAAPGSFVEDFFRLRYEKTQASQENIFRYEMKIENGSIFIAIDDLKQGRHLRRDKAVDPRLIAGIRDAIQEQQVFSLPENIEGKSQDVWDSWKLSVVSRGESRVVQVVNRIPPDNFKKVCSMIERFGEAELGMVALSMSAEELNKRAKDAYQRARKLYDERFVKVENLSSAIKAYTETIWYLDTLEPKPPVYADAIHGKQVAMDELEQQIKDHEFRAARSIQLQEWPKARDELLLILQKLPDPSDKHNQDARVRLLDVEKRIQPQ